MKRFLFSGWARFVLPGLLACSFLASGSIIAADPALAAQIKLAHDQPEKSPHHQAALKWKEMVESQTKGEVSVQIFPANMLGSGTQIVEQLQAGAVEAAVLPTGWIAPLVPSVSALDLPFLFPNRSIAYEIIDGPIGDEILAPLNKIGIEGVAFWESGFKQLTGNFPISLPSDYQGHKIRTMPAPVIQEQFKAFGAAPTPINFAELYTALQQNVVDGQENPIATIASMKFYEVQEHMTLSDHGFLAYVFMFNKNFLDSLSPQVQSILVESAKQARDYERDIIQKAESTHLETFKSAGMKISSLTSDARSKFEQASEPVYDWYANKYGGELLKKIRDAAAKAN